MNTKTVYSYNPQTGEYIGPDIAQKSPLEEGVYMIPAHATETAPPEIGENEIAVWGGKKWSTVQDFRGREGYVNGEYTEITELGPLPEGWSDTLPPPTLDEAKAAKMAEIADARWCDEVGGIVINGVKMYTDRDSQAKYTGAVVTYNMRQTWPPAWKGMDGWLPLTSGDDLINLAEAVEQHVQALFVREAQIEALVMAAETVDEVQAISW